MSLEPQIMKTPKNYWITRRIDGHSDWGFGFWRELFQNSVDAGSKRIDITVDNQKGKGSFGREANVEDVVRVTFKDDGNGMTENIIRNVFLSPGETTKKYGDMTGGFGTARIMLCFSQVRYGFITNNIIVEGDGSEYTCKSIPDTLYELKQSLVMDAKDVSREIEYIERNNLSKGCFFEIDIDPNESSYQFRNMTKKKLLDKLENYLSMSQIPCDVYINGELSTLKTKKGKTRKELFYKNDSGDFLPFATVHLSESDKAKYKGCLIIRVNGATMYHIDNNIAEQVVVELDAKMSKNILTDNRDGLKNPFADSIYEFIRELEANNMSALKQKSVKKTLKISGELGQQFFNSLNSNITPFEDIKDNEIKENDTDTEDYSYKEYNVENMNFEEYENKDLFGVPNKLLRSLLEIIKEGKFDRKKSQDFYNRQDVLEFMEAVRNNEGFKAFSKLEGNSFSRLIFSLKYGMQKSKNNQVKNIHDTHIHIDNIQNKELVNLSKRYSPDYWRMKGEEGEGRGLEAHMVLIAWTSFCKEALRVLSENGTPLKEPIKFSTGWYFGESEERYNGEIYVKQRTEAQHHLLNDGTHLLLLNPVLENMKPAFNLQHSGGKVYNDKGEVSYIGLQGIEALAAHEVAHIFSNTHNEYFASVLTRIISSMERGRARRDMFNNINYVRQHIYGKGPAIIQNMDLSDSDLTIKIPKPRKTIEEAIRPSDVLLMHSFPSTTSIYGLTSGKETNVFNSMVESSIVEEGNHKNIDCELMKKLENTMEVLAVNDFDISNLDLDFSSNQEKQNTDMDFDILSLDTDFSSHKKDTSIEILGEDIEISSFKF